MTYTGRLIAARRGLTARRRLAERQLLLKMREHDRDLSAMQKRILKYIELDDQKGFDLLARLKDTHIIVQQYNEAYSREFLE